MNRRDFLRRAGLASAGLASLPVFADVAHADGADHVRWDIPSVDFLRRQPPFAQAAWPSRALT